MKKGRVESRPSDYDGLVDSSEAAVTARNARRRVEDLALEREVDQVFDL